MFSKAREWHARSVSIVKPGGGEGDCAPSNEMKYFVLEVCDVPTSLVYVSPERRNKLREIDAWAGLVVTGPSGAGSSIKMVPDWALSMPWLIRGNGGKSNGDKILDLPLVKRSDMVLFENVGGCSWEERERVGGGAEIYWWQWRYGAGMKPAHLEGSNDTLSQRGVCINVY